MRLIFREIKSFARYKYPYNINREQRIDYLQQIQKAEQSLAQNQKLSQGGQNAKRKKRIYDRPRIDRNITGYGAWRLHDEEEWLLKFNQNALQVLLKINIAPKWLTHAFGKGTLPRSHHASAHREFMFQDNQLNSYLLYEYRNTTDYKPNKQDYDYENQDHLHPRMRIYRRTSPQQFWASQQQYQFRINGTQYAQKHKFKQWLVGQIEARKSMKNYDQYIDEKFGKCLTFNKLGQDKQFVANKAMISHVTPEHYQPKKGKTPKPPKPLTWSKLGQQHRINNSDHQQVSIKTQ